MLKGAAIALSLAAATALVIRASQVSGFAAPERNSTLSSPPTAPSPSVASPPPSVAAPLVSPVVPPPAVPLPAVSRPGAPPDEDEDGEPEEEVLVAPRDALVSSALPLPAELAPRAAVTAEPLVPPVIHLEAVLAPRGPVTAEPLVSPIVETKATPAPR